MIAAIIFAILIGVVMLAVKLVSISWYSRWVDTLPEDECEDAWRLYWLLDTAPTPEEQAMIMYHIKDINHAR